MRKRVHATLVATGVVVSILAGVAALPKATKTPPCAGGRFVVHDRPIIAAGAVVTGADTVVISAKQVQIASGCALVPVKLTGTRTGTKVKAGWRTCTGLTGKVKLRAKIVPGCQSMSGTVTARKFKQPFTATLTQCGDGLFDPGVGEQCDGATVCEQGFHCDGDCHCVEGGATTTTTIGTSTSTSTTIPRTTTSSTAPRPTTTTTSITTTTTLPGLASLVDTVPANGEAGVAVGRPVTLRFSAPLAPATLTALAVHAAIGSTALPAGLALSSDRATITLTATSPLPPSARVRVTVDGGVLQSAAGVAADADGDGVPGGIATIDFETVTLAPVAGTRICGRVFAADPVPGPPPVDNPLQTATITVDGNAALHTTTDATGNFCLDPAPAGAFFAHVDGRTVTRGVPAGASYAMLGVAWQGVAGRETNVGDVFLPLAAAGTLTAVGAGVVTLTFPAAVLAQHPAYAGTRVTVPAGALVADDGTRGGKAGLVAVAAGRLPQPLPAGLEPALVVAVVTDGGTRFDAPAPVCVANLPDPSTHAPLAAGTAAFLFAADGRGGEWQPVGPMTVAVDGSVVCTDAGVGLDAPGLLAVGPPPLRPEPPAACERPRAGDEACTSIADCLAHTALRDLGCARCQADDATTRDQCAWEYDRCRRSCAQAWARHGASLDACVADPNACGTAFGVANVCAAECAPENTRCVQRAYCDASATPPPFDAETRLATPGATVDRVVQKLEQMKGVIGPSYLAGGALPAAAASQVTQLRTEAGALAGGDAPQYLRSFFVQREQAAAGREATAGPALHFVPTHPVRYVAEVQRPSGLLRLRGQTAPFGDYALLVPRDGTLLSVTLHDPVLDAYAVVFPNVRPDAPFALPRFSLQAVDARLADADGDALPDVLEAVYGTDPMKPDSDGDGVADGAEVREGADPLAAPPLPGVVATVPTEGPAGDVVAFDNVAITSEADRGVSIFNVFNGLAPTRIGHVDTPGTALAAALAGTTIAVADGAAGLALIDMSDPAAARVVRQVGVGGTARAVVAAGDVVYVGTDTGLVVAVEVRTGIVLGSADVDGVVQDLGIDGDTLLVLRQDALLAFGFGSAAPQRIGIVNTTNVAADPTIGRNRLFVGGGLAYAAGASGYDSVDVRDPAHMQRVGRVDPGTLAPFRHLVANGAGLGVAAAAAGGAKDVALFDLADPTNTNHLKDGFATPGDARALAIFDGLAYVADGDHGLAVLEYDAVDRAGSPPTITLQPGFVPSHAPEGKRVRVTALASDDVQVRNVEFFIDDAKVATDGNFPFELRFTTPARSVQPSFVLRARATDTGGNATWSAPLTVVLDPDKTPPTVTGTTPAANRAALAGELSTVLATFSEPIDRATLGAATFQLVSAGADGALGTGDDTPVAGATISYRPTVATAVMTFASPLPVGLYQATLAPPLADVAGNPLAAPFVWTFRVTDGVRWITDHDGRWDAGANWSTGAPPGPGDIVVIDRPNADVTVTHFFKYGGDAIESLRCTEALVLTNDTGLTINGPARVDGPLTVNGASTLVLNGDLVVGGPLTVQSASVGGAGHLLARGGATFDGASLFGVVDNAGVASIGGGGLIGTGDGILNNQAGATLALDADTTIQSIALNNAGTLMKRAGTGVSLIASALNGTGPIDVRSGTLRFYALAQSAPVTIADGAAIELTFNNAFLQGASISGAGTARVTGGRTTIAAPVTVDHFEITGNGETIGPGTLSVTKTLNLVFGSLDGPGATNLAAGGTGTLTTVAFRNGATVNNSGAVTFSGDRIDGDGTAIWNNHPGATFTVTGDPGSNGMIFNNAGTFTKQGSAGTTIFTNWVLNNAGTVAVQTGTLNLNSVTGTSTGAFTVAAGATLGLSQGFGTLTLGAGSSLTGAGSVAINGGRVNVNGTYGVTGPLTMANKGVAAFNSDVTLTAPVTFTFQGGIAGTGTVTVANTLSTSGGGMAEAGTTIIAPRATMTFDGDSDVFFSGGRTIRNAGTIVWQDGGNVGADGTATIENLATGTFVATNDRAFNGIVVDNAGTFRKEGGTATTAVHNGIFNNTGTVEARTGTFQLGFFSGGASTGTFRALAGAAVEFASGHTLGTGAALTGDGDLRMVNGIVRVNGDDVHAARLTLAGATIGGTGRLTVDGPFAWSAGHLQEAATTVVPAGQTLAIAGADVFIDGPHTLDVSGTVTWSGTGGIFGSGTLITRPGGTVVAQNDQRISVGVMNGGTFEKLGGTGTTSYMSGGGTGFDDPGTLDIRTGTFRLESFTTGAVSGAILTQPGTALETVSLLKLDDGASMTGPGPLRLLGGRLVVTGNASADRFEMSSQSLEGTGTLTIGTSMLWAGGNMNGTGTTAISPGATLTIGTPAGGSLGIFGWTLDNAGTILWTGPTAITGGNQPTLNNSGTLSIQNDREMSGVVVNNSGAIVKAGSTGTTFFGGNFQSDVQLDNTGTVTVQDGGTLVQSGPGHGTGSFVVTPTSSLVFTSAPAYTFEGGAAVTGGGSITNNRTLVGLTSLQGNLLNAGTLTPGTEGGASALAISGTFTQLTAGVLAIDVGGPTAGSGYDQVNVGGAATLAGTLRVRNFGGFTPASGSPFTVMTYASKSGAFTNLDTAGYATAQNAAAVTITAP